MLVRLAYLVVPIVLGLTLLLERPKTRCHFNRPETDILSDADTEDAVASSSKKHHRKRRRNSCFGGADIEPLCHKFDARMLTEPWRDVFVAGADGGGEQKFHCIICKHDVSVLGKDASELLRHFASKGHFPRDQQFRFIDDDVAYNELGRRFENMDPDLRTEMLSRSQLLEDPNKRSCGISANATRVSSVVFLV